MHELMTRIADNLELIAAELERLRVLREFELGVRIDDQPDPHVVRVEVSEE